MTKRTILITGSTDGIGKETALRLASLDHNIILHGKNEIKLKSTFNFIVSKTGNKNIDYIIADLSEINNINNIIPELKLIEKKFGKIDTLYNNAGVFMVNKKVNSKGIEFTFMINYLAVFYITYKLFPLLLGSAKERIKKKNQKFYKSRIINVASMAHADKLDFENLNAEKFYDPYTAYSYSKLEDIMFTYELNDKLVENSFNNLITVNCLHPGVISTKLLHSGWGFGGSSVSEGAKRLVYMLNKDLENISGKYFYDMKVSEPADFANKKNAREKLWLLSEKYLNIKFSFTKFNG